MQLTYWHVMKDTWLDNAWWQVTQAVGIISRKTFTPLNLTCLLASFLPVFLSLHCLSLPQTSSYTQRTIHPHTHYPSQPSPCAHIYTHTNTKMDQFHILFQDAEDAMSHCQFTARCLIPPNSAMQISYCFFFFCMPSFFFTAWYVLNNYLPTSDATSCGLFLKIGQSFWQGTVKTITKLTNWKKCPHCVVV